MHCAKLGIVFLRACEVAGSSENERAQDGLMREDVVFNAGWKITAWRLTPCSICVDGIHAKFAYSFGVHWQCKACLPFVFARRKPADMLMDMHVNSLSSWSEVAESVPGRGCALVRAFLDTGE